METFRHVGRSPGSSTLLIQLLLVLTGAVLLARQGLASEFVYAVHNRTHNSYDNNVSGFTVDSATGRLTAVPGSPFATMGQGREGGLFVGKRIASTPVGDRLYVSNNHGADTITGFTINRVTGSLSLPTQVATGADDLNYGISLAVSQNGKFLFAGLGGSGRVAVFDIDSSTGALTHVPGSPFALGVFNIANLAISPDNRFLALATPGGTNASFVRLYSVSSSGGLTPSASLATFGQATSVGFNCKSNRLITGGDLSRVTSYNVSTSGVLAELGYLAMPHNTQAVQLSVDDAFVFTSDIHSRISTVQISPADVFSSVGVPLVLGALQPTGLSVNQQGTLLFSANRASLTTPDLGNIGVYRIASSGALEQVPGSPFATSVVGNMNSLAASPPKVCATNSAPLGASQQVVVSEDTAAAITLAATDADGDPLTYAIVRQPVNGTLSGGVPNVSYTPNANYNGVDSFTFTVSDGSETSAIATIDISVTPVNDAPIADSKSVTTDEDTPLVLSLTGSDVDGDALTISVQTQPSQGSLSGTPPNLLYTPNPNFNGLDSFQFRVTDGILSATGTISITIIAVNDAPTAPNRSISTPEDTPVNITLTGADADGDTLQFSLVSSPAKGLLSGTAPAYTYSPQANFHGLDSFSYMVSDGKGAGTTATITITVLPVNDAPILNPLAPLTALEGQTVYLTATAGDVDGDSLTYAWDLNSDGVFETLSQTVPFYALEGPIVYTPKVRVSDGVLFDIKTASITVANVAPSVTISGPQSGAIFAVNAPVTFAGTYSDPGLADTHKAYWVLDGIATTPAIVAGGVVSTVHTFTTPGVYQVQLIVADDDNGQASASTVASTGLTAMVVIYDPSAGFVTGGGWIQSPPGAYVNSSIPDATTLIGKANFGFYSKYLKGASTPTGETEFHFKAGELSFSSVSYDWLVVGSSRAQFKGSGAIAGRQGQYGFLLTAIDGEIPGGGGIDKLRMKIWNKSDGAVVYDNKMNELEDNDASTELGGGNIKIHRK